MISRVMAGLLVAGSLTFGVVGMTGVASARDKPTPVRLAPELDPAVLGGGLALMLGTVLAVSERRRGKK